MLRLTLIPRHPAASVLIAVLLWGAACLPGLNAVGLVNWQESARALAASEMQSRGEWIVPTIAGRPYLAKPPMIYWCVMGLAELAGERVSESHLRWTVALAGLAGVVGTLAAGRSLLAGGIDRSDGAGGDLSGQRLRELGALWAAAFLATGVLYVRSSRIGELDILLAPFTVAAVWGSAWSWMNDRAAAAQRVAAVAVAGVGAAGAALTKGPPALISIALAVAGGIALAESVGNGSPSHGKRRASVLGGALLLAGLSLWSNRDSLTQLRTLLGAGLLACGGAGLGLAFAWVTEPRAWKPTIRGWWSSGIGFVIAAGICSLWAWGRAVEARVGAEAIAATVGQEAADNLRPLSPDAPLQNVEAVLYGAGLGSVACIAAAVWLITRPPRIGRGWWIVIAWAGLGLVVFSVAGRGTGRYLTPLWPAIALLGGIWTARAVRDMPRGKALGTALATGVLVLAGAQGWWYAVRRPDAEGARSPREFMADLLSPGNGVDPMRLGVVDYWVGSLNVYAGHPVEPITDLGPWIDFPHEETPMAAFADRLRRTGEVFVLLIRASPANDPQRGAVDASIVPVDHLAAYGLAWEEVRVSAPFLVDRQRTAMRAVRVRAAPGS